MVRLSDLSDSERTHIMAKELPSFATEQSVEGPPLPQRRVAIVTTAGLHRLDDLRTWYLHAVSQQPGRAGSHERNTWFWRQTAFAHLLGHVPAALADHPEPRVRSFANRGIVPRDHWRHLTTSTRQAQRSDG